MRIFRISDNRHPVWDGSGAMHLGGRFNHPGRPVIYGALTFAGAMLEVLAHTRIGKIPDTHVWVAGDIPDDIAIEHHTFDSLPSGWHNHGSTEAQAFGDAWLSESRTAVLVVPSVVARLEFNALVNPAHPDAARIVVSSPEPVIWDERLFHAP